MSDEHKPAKPDTPKPRTEQPPGPEVRNGGAQAKPAGMFSEELDPGDDLSPAADVGADVTAVLSAEVEKLEAQVADLTDRLLRAHADIENLRKRGEREKQETARYAISKFARDTVEVVDNFGRALQAVPANAADENPQLKALLEGVSMTEREFLNVLERHGVKRVSPKGEAFDPRLHQAVMERQEPQVANGTVVEVFQAGYMIEDRCLRPAMVVVARGGGKMEKAAAADAGPQPTSEPSPEPSQDGGEAGTTSG